MAKFRGILATLRKAERDLQKQLAGIRSAISSLEFGSGGGAPLAVKRRPARRMTAAQKKAVSARMKKYWAARKKR